MTTKDYKVLADVFATALNEESTPAGRVAIEDTLVVARKRLLEDNPRFNAATFNAAIRDKQFDLATGQGRR